MARVALIDGDSIAHRIAAACEKTRYLVGDYEYATHKEAVAAASDVGVIWKTTTLGEFKGAAASLESVMERSIARAQAGVFHVFIGGGGPTFREHVARLKKYKGNRSGDRPKHLGDLRDYLIRYWGAVQASGEEADDMLSYTAADLRDQNDTIIIGNDKDLDQIPGEHYDWVKDKLYTVTDAEARLRLWVQVLSGDVADNIGGCWRVGASKAERAIKQCIEEHKFSDSDLWDFVCYSFKESQELEGCPYAQYDPVDVALENYNLVRLRQNRHEKHEYRGLFPKAKAQEAKVPVEVRSDDIRGSGQTGSQV